jgi:hypothetical protein
MGIFVHVKCWVRDDIAPFKACVLDIYYQVKQRRQLSNLSYLWNSLDNNCFIPCLERVIEA